jgi:RNA polymerase sigma-70 factor (ECF subfamily)
MLTALDSLSEDHREILVLRYYDDLSYAEIADVLQVKLGTVMSRLSRARMRLMDVMKPSELAN